MTDIKILREIVKKIDQTLWDIDHINRGTFKVQPLTSGYKMLYGKDELFMTFKDGNLYCGSPREHYFLSLADPDFFEKIAAVIIECEERDNCTISSPDRTCPMVAK